MTATASVPTHAFFRRRNHTGIGRMRILIADDDRKLARQLKKGVDESGHVTTLAYHGLEALATAEAGAFDVLVLDVMMPGMDGVTLCSPIAPETNRHTNPALDGTRRPGGHSERS